jgi:hypothetical protein
MLPAGGESSDTAKTPERISGGRSANTHFFSGYLAIALGHMHVDSWICSSSHKFWIFCKPS